MPRQKEITVYRFSELSDKAKQHAKNDFAAAMGFSSADDYLKSLRSLAEHFGGKLRDYNVDFFGASHSSASFDMPEMEAEEIERRMTDLGGYDPETLRSVGDCKLTGFCGDEDAIDGFRQAWHSGERDLDRLMQSAFKSWLRAAQAHCEGDYEDDSFGEMSDVNDYEYDAAGDLA